MNTKNQIEDILDVELRLIAHPAERPPSSAQQCQELYGFAALLGRTGIDVQRLYVMGDPNVPAFSSAGPSIELVESAKSESSAAYQTAHIWNGREGRGGVGFGSQYGADGRLMLDFRADGINTLASYSVLADLLEGALQIWPASLVQVAPYFYSTRKKVFPDRPGVGWMLYLPRRIEQEQVPEARRIRHVKDLNGTEGTIIISETDGPFDADSTEHVKVANAIEIRLADQDLLPRYVDI